MGWVMMSERDLNRVEVLAQVDDGRLSVENVARMLALTRRQIIRLLKLYCQDGASAIRHKARGKPPNNRIHKAKRDFALSLVKEDYPDFGPMLAGSGDAGRVSRLQGLARDDSQVVARRWALALAQTAPDISSAQNAQIILWRAHPD